MEEGPDQFSLARLFGATAFFAFAALVARWLATPQLDALRSTVALLAISAFIFTGIASLSCPKVPWRFLVGSIGVCLLLMLSIGVWEWLHKIT